MTNEEILNHLAILSYDRDARCSPDTARHGQFVAGWKDAAVRHQQYTEDTLKSLTWHNLGFRFGQHFGNKPEEGNQTGLGCSRFTPRRGHQFEEDGHSPALPGS